MKIIKAFQISDSINLKLIKSNFHEKLIHGSSTELFFKSGESYISVYNFGVICFSNSSVIEMNNIIKFISPYTENLIDDKNSDDITVEFKDSDILFENGTLFVPENIESDNFWKIVMFNLSESVALDYYNKISEDLLSEVKKLSLVLKNTGKIGISKKEMIKFIGKSLNTKNNIVDTLYIFDSPELTWDDETLDKLHKILAKTFDISSRFKEVEYTFKIIDNNLEIFNTLSETKKSTELEIVVIVLILIEVLNTFADKFNIF